jgi:hypothetical protein
MAYQDSSRQTCGRVSLLALIHTCYLNVSEVDSASLASRWLPPDRAGRHTPQSSSSTHDDRFSIVPAFLLRFKHAKLQYEGALNTFILLKIEH